MDRIERRIAHEVKESDELASLHAQVNAMIDAMMNRTKPPAG